MILIGWLMMTVADPVRIPVPSPPAPVVVTTTTTILKPKPISKPVVLTIQMRVLKWSRFLLGQSPSYSLDEGWCWAFVEDVLFRARAGVSPVEGTAYETTKPVPGDLVYLVFPTKINPTELDWIAHVAVFESSDTTSITVINGNGSSTSKITRDRFPIQYVDYFVSSSPIPPPE